VLRLMDIYRAIERCGHFSPAKTLRAQCGPTVGMRRGWATFDSSQEVVRGFEKLLHESACYDASLRLK
jgi:hypothetical protein